MLQFVDISKLTVAESADCKKVLQELTDSIPEGQSVEYRQLVTEVANRLNITKKSAYVRVDLFLKNCTNFVKSKVVLSEGKRCLYLTHKQS